MTRMTSTKALVSNSMPSAPPWLNCSPRSQDRSHGAESDLSKTIANLNRQKNRPLFLFHLFKERLAIRPIKFSLPALSLQILVAMYVAQYRSFAVTGAKGFVHSRSAG